jgi:uncharacterized membrane protein YhaH (DUF805 family)
MLAFSAILSVGMYRGDNNTPSPEPSVIVEVLFFVCMAMVLVWFMLMRRLFKRIETCHPEKYEAMGSPSLQRAQSASWPLLKFLFGREYRALDDPYLTKLSKSMLSYFFVYLVIFITTCCFVIAQGNGK